MSKRQLPKSRSVSSVSLEPEAAIAIIGLFSGAADGEGIDSTEEDALGEILSGIPQFTEYSDADFEELTETIVGLIEAEKPEDLIAEAIASLPNEEYREAAYVTAVVVVAVDGEIPEAEEEYLTELQEALNISDERAEEILDELFGDEEDEEDEEDE